MFELEEEEPQTERWADIETDANREARGKRVGGRKNGSANYTTADVDALLDVVEDVEPIGAQEWAIVSSRYNDWAATSGRPLREQTSLKIKFDKLCSSKKPTGDPSCPPEVRRAKHISREILARCNAVSLRGESDSDLEVLELDTASSTVQEDDRDTRNEVGARKRRRRAGATGLERSKKKKTGEIGSSFA